MNDLIAYAQTIIDFLSTNGANLNIESQQALGQLLQNILQVIDQPQEQQQAPNEAPLQPAPNQLQEAFPSSNVEGFAYDENSGNLFVRFLGDYPNRNGPVYSYQGVPPWMFQALQRGSLPAKTNGRNRWGQWWVGKTPSIGATFHELIQQGGYPYQRVS